MGYAMMREGSAVLSVADAPGICFAGSRKAAELQGTVMLRCARSARAERKEDDMDRGVLFNEAEWRMPVDQAAGAKHFPVGQSGASVAIYPYHHAERPHAGGGHWGMLLVDGFPFIVMTRHIFFTTPEKVGNEGPGKKFYHVHLRPQQIVNTPFEHPMLIAEVDGWTELDYLVNGFTDAHYLQALLAMDGHYDAAKRIEQRDVDAVAEAIRAYVPSKEGRAAAVANEAPPYWLNILDAHAPAGSLAA